MSKFCGNCESSPDFKKKRRNFHTFGQLFLKMVKNTLEGLEDKTINQILIFLREIDFGKKLLFFFFFRLLRTPASRRTRSRSTTTWTRPGWAPPPWRPRWSTARASSPSRRSWAGPSWNWPTRRSSRGSPGGSSWWRTTTTANEAGAGWTRGEERC